MIGVAALMAMTSCDNPTYPGGDNGNTDGKDEAQGQVSLSQLSIKVNVSDIEMGSRAANVEDLSKYTINIKRVNRASDEGNQSFLYGDMPELIALPVGNYVVEAYNAEEQVAAFDAPYFQGESNQFTVKANDIVTVDPIVCTLTNVKVSIDYTDELRAHMSDVTVTVTVAESETLDFAGDETRSGYFKYVEGNTTIAATFNGKVDGFEVSDYRVLTNAVAPGYHHTITFSLKDTPTPPDEYGSIGDTGISLYSTVPRVDVNGDIDPGDEELIEPDAPKEYLTVGTTAVNCGCDASQSNVQVKSSDAWTAEGSASWCTVTKTESGMTVAVAANSDANNDRTATITVTMGKLTATIAVTQAKYTEAPQGPVIDASNFDLVNGNYNTDFDASNHPASLTVDAPNKIARFVIDIESTDDGFKTDLAALQHFDIANPDGLESTLDPLGLIYGDQVKGQTRVKFDITRFMGMLNSFTGSTNRFKITVTDEAGGESTVTLIIKVN